MDKIVNNLHSIHNHHYDIISLFLLDNYTHLDRANGVTIIRELAMKTQENYQIWTQKKRLKKTIKTA